MRFEIWEYVLLASSDVTVAAGNAHDARTVSKGYYYGGQENFWLRLFSQHFHHIRFL